MQVREVPSASLAGLPALAYDERAAARSWAAMTALLEEAFELT
jgi:hypothetical protein